MSFSVTIDWDAHAKRYISDRVTERALFNATRMAGRDAQRAMRAASKRGIRERTRIRAGYLADRSFPLPHARGRKLADLEWKMPVSGKEVPLGEYPRRQNRKGVSVEIQRGKRQTIKSAFLARSRSGRLGVFKRPTERRYKMGHRLGLRVSDSMRNGRVPRLALDRAADVFTRGIERLFPLELQKLR